MEIVDIESHGMLGSCGREACTRFNPNLLACNESGSRCEQTGSRATGRGTKIISKDLWQGISKAWETRVWGKRREKESFL